MILHKYLKLNLKLCFLFIAFSLGNIPITKASELNWEPATSHQNNSQQFEPQQSDQGSFSEKSLTLEELEQTIQGLQLINILGISASNNQIELLKKQLKQLRNNQSSPYQLSSSQFQKLRTIFSELTQTELATINNILLIKNTNQSINLTQEEIVSLRETLSNIPGNRLSDLQNKQLTVILDFLKNIPQQQSVALSSKQTEALGRAINFVFFTPTAGVGQTAQFPKIEDTKRVTLNQEELNQIINGLQAVQTLQLRPNQSTEIANLLNQLKQLQNTSNIVSLSPDTTQQLRTLIGSLSPNETAAIEIVLLSDRAPNNLTLTQQQIDNLIRFFQQLPESELSNVQQQKRQELTKFLKQLQAQEKTKFQLSSTQTRQLLEGIQSFLFDRGGTTVSRKQFQDIVTYLKTAQEELSLSSSQTQTLNRLLSQLEEQQATQNNQFVISPQQNRQLTTLIDSLNRGQREAIQRALVVKAGGSVSNPAISVLNPIGYGNSWGNIGIGLSFQERTRFGDSEDGTLSFSMGFGDPERSLGFDATVTILSLTDQNQSAAFSTGSMSFEVSRNLPGNSAVSVGVENLIRWPEDSGDTATTTYLVGSTLFQLREDPFSPFGLAYLSAGIGNGRFRPPEAFDPNDDNKGFEGFFEVSPFASAAIQVLPRVNAIAEWTGQDISLGLSMVPFKESPLVITVAAIDLTGNVEETFGREGEPRFTAAVSYGFFF